MTEDCRKALNFKYPNLVLTVSQMLNKNVERNISIYWTNKTNTNKQLLVSRVYTFISFTICKVQVSLNIPLLQINYFIA